jgi:hypothetical protein
MTKDCIYLTLASLMFLFGMFSVPLAPTPEGVWISLAFVFAGALGVGAALIALAMERECGETIAFSK